jgi:hypothetical protein
MADEKESTVEGVLKGAAELAKAIPVYQDGLQPASKAFGEAIQPAGRHVGDAIALTGRTVGLALSPLRAVVWGFEKFQEVVVPELARRFEAKLHQLVTPKPYVAVPALEALRYTGEEPALREMYVNLLATAMDRQTAVNAHPAFVTIIRELTPDEARLVRYCRDQGQIELSSAADEYPELLRTRLANPAGCQHPDLIDNYLQNLDRLKLIMYLPTRSKGGGTETIRYALSLLSFGVQFCKACLPETGGGDSR